MTPSETKRTLLVAEGDEELEEEIPEPKEDEGGEKISPGDDDANDNLEY